MRLILVRHGETIENQKGICQGQMEGTLSDNGIEQAKRVAEFLKSEKIDVIYSSDLKRALDTANEVVKQFPNSPFYQDKRIRERYFGSFQGKLFPENRKNLVIPPDAESDLALFQRVNEFYNEIIEKHFNHNVLIVSHGVTLRVMLAIIQSHSNIDSIEPLSNGSISIIEVISPSHNQIININLLKHL